MKYLTDGSCDCELCRQSMISRWKSHLQDELNAALVKIDEYRAVPVKIGATIGDLEKKREKLRASAPDDFKMLDLYNTKINVLTEMLNDI